MINKTEQYIKSMLKNNLFTVVYPRDRSQKSAQKMIEMIDSAIGIAEFKDSDGNTIWGVLIDKAKENKNVFELNY